MPPARDFNRPAPDAGDGGARDADRMRGAFSKENCGERTDGEATREFAEIVAGP